MHSVGALVRRCSKLEPHVEIERSGDDSLDLRVDYGQRVDVTPQSPR